MSIFGVIRNFFRSTSAEAIPDNAILIDVRSPKEFSAGSVANAINIPVNQIFLVSQHPALVNKSTPIVVFCATGMRSSLARRQLLSMGYVIVINGGGLSKMLTSAHH